MTAPSLKARAEALTAIPDKRGSCTHELKTWASYFHSIVDGTKTFEIRKADRDFRVGDFLLLRETEYGSGAYTGREATRRITHILEHEQDLGLCDGFAILSLENCSEAAAEQRGAQAERDRLASLGEDREALIELLARAMAGKSADMDDGALGRTQIGGDASNPLYRTEGVKFPRWYRYRVEALAVVATVAALIGAEREKQAWRPIETAPKDSTPVWAYLYESGVRLVRYVSPEELARDGGGEPAEYVDNYWVEVENESEAWAPLYWLPRDTLPPAPPASADTKGQGQRHD